MHELANLIFIFNRYIYVCVGVNFHLRFLNLNKFSDENIKYKKYNSAKDVFYIKTIRENMIIHYFNN